MPASSDFTSALDRQLLVQLGSRLKSARLKQGLTAVALAQQVGISRGTLASVEAGDPSPTMGTYLRVMSALGIAGDLALLASEAIEPPVEGERKQGRTIVAKAGDAGHDLQDLQSLMLHKEAVRLMRMNPKLIQKAIDTLEKWRASGDVRTRFLWDEWSVILHRRDWRKALAPTRRSKELRQASPLPTVLPHAVREDVLAQIRELKSGKTLGHMALPVRATNGLRR
jgi:transcriptional regulator with XRE-family HTH domain